MKVAPDWTGTCPDIKDGTPAAIFMTTAGAKASDESVGMAGDEQMRLVFVDIGQGDIVAIWIDSTDPRASTSSRRTPCRSSSR